MEEPVDSPPDDGIQYTKVMVVRAGSCDIFSRSRKDTRRRGVETKPSKQHV